MLATARLSCCRFGPQRLSVMDLVIAGGRQQHVRSLQIAATPSVARMDEPVAINVTGLSPGQPVTMAARLTEEGNTFVSHGHYTADQDGVVDLNTHQSAGGTYQGCEPMGLFWSLRPQEGSKPGLRLRKKDVTKPHHITLSVLDAHITADSGLLHDEPRVLAQQDLERYYAWKDVVRIPVRHGAVRGTLFVPNGGQGRHQGVIDIYGSTGGLAEYRAAMLASRGFTTLALAYVGYEDLPDGLEVDLGYFLEAADYLSAHANVRPGGLGAIGISLGATMALNLSLMSPKIKAVVSIGGGDFFYMFLPRYQGKDMPFAVADFSDAETRPEGLSPLKSMYNSDGQEEARIPVEKATHTDFLFLHGTMEENADPRLILRMTHRMVENGHKNFSVHMYQGAGHLIEPPYIPFCYASWHRVFGVSCIWGGEARLHSKAQEDAWGKILHFFKDRLPAAKL